MCACITIAFLRYLSNQQLQLQWFPFYRWKHQGTSTPANATHREEATSSYSKGFENQNILEGIAVSELYGILEL